MKCFVFVYILHGFNCSFYVTCLKIRNSCTCVFQVFVLFTGTSCLVPTHLYTFYSSEVIPRTKYLPGVSGVTFSPVEIPITNQKSEHLSTFQHSSSATFRQCQKHYLTRTQSEFLIRRGLMCYTARCVDVVGISDLWTYPLTFAC